MLRNSVFVFAFLMALSCKAESNSITVEVKKIEEPEISITVPDHSNSFLTPRGRGRFGLGFRITREEAVELQKRLEDVLKEAVR